MTLLIPDGPEFQRAMSDAESAAKHWATQLGKIRALTAPPTYSGRVDPASEDGLSMQVASALHEWVITGRLAATYTKIPHEVGAVSRKSHAFKAAQSKYAKQRAMGMVTGSADFVLVWSGGGGWIELKKKGNSLAPSQADFRSWCSLFGVRHAICHSVADVEDVLREWGVLSWE